jgi:DNA invertase Pin-like site-specific DNA recombinase
MNAICYVRVSTLDQAEEGVSLAAQEEKTRAFCVARGWDCAGVIRDEGVSGGTLDRPGLQEALDRCRRGEAQVLVVLKLDRLTRSVKDLGELLDEVFNPEDGPADFASVEDNFDTSTANGRLVLNVLASVAQWEREVIVERTTAALQHKRREGRRAGQVPFGFTLAEDGDRLLPVPEEHDVIEEIKERREAGDTLQGIADDLNARGVPTKNGGRWWPATVANIANADLPEVAA